MCCYRTMAEVAEQFGVHPGRIQDRMRQLVEQAGELLARGVPSDGVSDATVQAFHAKIGKR